MNSIKQRNARLATVVAAAGILLGGVVVSPVLAVAQPIAATHPPAVAVAAAGSVSGSRSALVITVALNGATNLPTSSSIAANVIDASRPWFLKASHGLFGGYYALNRGAVTVQTTTDPCFGPWLQEIGDKANAAIIKQEPNLDLNRNGNLDEFGAVVYYFDKVDTCVNPNIYAPQGAAGWGDLPAQSNRVWLNGYSDLGVAVHELGHNLGLNHSGSKQCVGPEPYEIPVPLSFTDAACTLVEYGDLFSSMGNHLADGYSPAQLAQLGWNTGRVVTVTASANTTHLVLTKAETDTTTGTQAVRLIDHSAAHGDTILWLEYRLPDTQTITDDGGSATSGLLVRQEQALPGGAQHGSPYLLSMNRTESDNGGLLNTYHPNMFVGQTWANPQGTMQITLNSANADTAQITISPVPLAQVPNLSFRTQFDAQNMITAAHLSTGTITTMQDRVCDDAGKVISQSPSAGTALATGGHVNFVIATPAAGSNCTGPPVGE